jgi:anti-sigma B factor antagonist
MKIEKRDEDGFRVVSLSGDVDLQNSQTLKKELLDAVGAGKPVVVEMSQVSYIDSSGVASLVEAYQTARKKNSSFALAGLSASAQRVLQLARLDRVFTIHPTLDRAMNRD